MSDEPKPQAYIIVGGITLKLKSDYASLLQDLREVISRWEGKYNAAQGGHIILTKEES